MENKAKKNPRRFIVGWTKIFSSSNFLSSCVASFVSWNHTSLE
jgi:hypothetical protein